ncbi:MAG: ABC transporter permease [Betaproteobacteria bacterium]
MFLQGYGASILGGAWVTLQLAVLSLALALVCGLVGAASKLSRSRLVSWPATAYSTVLRGVPDLVMMLLVFYGGQVLVNELTDALEWEPFDLNPFVAGVITIGVIFGAYFTETFRGAFLAVPAGQLEAGHAYGMTRWQVFSRILFPQMLRHALPGIGNNWLVLVKSTAIVSMIGLSDMNFIAEQAGRTTHQPFLFYMVVCALYLAITGVSSSILGHLERKYSAGVRHSDF